jgi:hypothetical protein
MWNDSLRFQTGHTKGDEDGTKCLYHSWHVYSVSQNPSIIPVLTFCKHLICNSRILNDKCKLFEGSNQYKQFNNILCSVVNSPEH